MDNSDMKDTNLVVPQGNVVNEFELLLKKYPRACKKMQMWVSLYQLKEHKIQYSEVQLVGICETHFEFQCLNTFLESDLIQVQIQIPDYWLRKQRFVVYRTKEQEDRFRVLAKIGKAEELSKRGKKRQYAAEIISLDEIDTMVLKSFLEENS